MQNVKKYTKATDYATLENRAIKPTLKTNVDTALWQKAR